MGMEVAMGSETAVGVSPSSVTPEGGVCVDSSSGVSAPVQATATIATTIISVKNRVFMAFFLIRR
jgi:hypothetical protein